MTNIFMYVFSFRIETRNTYCHCVHFVY